MSLISRKLLTPDEVLKIESPYILVMIPSEPPAILNVPDISKMYFNKLNGMGTKEENQKLRLDRENAREERKISKPKVWNIWDKVKNYDLEEIDEEEEKELEMLKKQWKANERKENVDVQEKHKKN